MNFSCSELCLSLDIVLAKRSEGPVRENEMLKIIKAALNDESIAKPQAVQVSLGLSLWPNGVFIYGFRESTSFGS